MAARKRAGGKLAQPRPRRNDDRLGRLLNRMDVADCGCKELKCLAGRKGHPAVCPGNRRCECPIAPCGHSLGADHGTPVGDWVRLLAAYDPAGYADPPPPPRPSMVIEKEPRLQILHERMRAGVALFHPDDVYARREESDEVAVVGGACRREAGVACDRDLLDRDERRLLAKLIARAYEYGPRSCHGREALWEVDQLRLYRQSWPDMAALVAELFCDAPPVTGAADPDCRFCRKGAARD